MALDTKPFMPLDDATVAALPGHMGVFELADERGEVLFIGMAGGRSTFGLRGEISARRALTRARSFRYEVTTAYLTRYQELLMRHQARSGQLPPENDAPSMKLGKLSIE